MMKYLWSGRRIILMIVVALVFMAVLGETSLAMSLQVAPHRFVFRIDEANTQVAVVTNTSDKPLRIKVYAELAPGQKTEEYLGDWVVIYPRLLSLKAGEKKVVRFSVRPPDKLLDGEYRTLLFFEELPQQQENTASTGETKVDLQFLTRLGINVYGQYGKIARTGELRDVELKLENKMLSIDGKFHNLGNAHLVMEANVMILDSKQQIVKQVQIPVFAVHRGMVQDFAHRMEFTGSGSYTLKILFKMDDSVIYEFNKAFEVRNTLI